MCQNTHSASRHRAKIQMLSGKESKRIPGNRKDKEVYHMKMIHKLFEQLKEGYEEYVRIVTCDYRF